MQIEQGNVMKRVRYHLITAGMFICGLASAKIQPADVFSNHMVLQQGMPVPVWGSATPGEKLNFHLAPEPGSPGSRQSKAATAGGDGKWRVELDPMSASATPLTLTIESPATGQRIQIVDVLIGEVWLFSGQSNMQWTFSPTSHGVFNGEQEIAKGNWPLIRQNSFPRGKRGWIPITPEVMPEVSAVPYFCARQLHQVLKVPIGILIRANGGTTVEQWSSPEALQQTDWGRKHKAFLESDQFKAYRKDYLEHDKRRRVWAEAKKAGKTVPEPKLEIPQEVLYHSVKKSQGSSWFYHWCLEPVVGYAIRGAAWYQGESNVSLGNNDRLFAYGEMLAAMVADWRKKWGRDFPCILVQLPNKGRPAGYAPASRWAVIREEIQYAADTLEKASMAVTIDTALDGNIHSIYKKPVGERLALHALGTAYPDNAIKLGTPTYQSMSVKDGKVRLNFKSIGGGLVLDTSKEPGFVIAGADKHFVPAKVELLGLPGQPNAHLIVWSDKVAEPVAVRYAWADNPPSSLHSQSGLPVAPFRTDSWEIPELGE